ncbi:peptidoglycan hydrolase-like protein with peptidoglycan-binding domain [Streptomyces sp. PanSC19]|uniref:glycoside hydrolase domain-containing protein n=1 Tax=Streptomyces sp. PanSC19 TaxID=1520455 RepID=UPI000F48B107|nr:glycoside hydrolase domain-containing protein [Streptomyces sp. PanSC19]ROQ26534.1 peptidoglycan hydrolase-like protein with peptidoglycan-binding domain [Streptomyces sp. PanSC19]
MSSRIPWRVRAGTATLAVLAGVGAFAAPGSATAASPPGTGRQTVTYHGYRVEVPADWQVVDLAERPQACLRFDRPAVYLGEPAEQSDCPAHLVGRTAGIVVEPLTARSAGQATAATARTPRGKATAPTAVSSNGTIQVAVEDAGVLVTAAHTPATEHLVRDVLASAALTPDARRTELPRAAQRPDATPLAAAGPQPGGYLGKGFDTCAAPSQAAMNAWQAGSPYSAVGVYISGSFRACAQPNLTASWVTGQTGNGWRLIPIDVGRQAPCTNFSLKMSTDPATAKSQGVTAAAAALTAAANLGIPAGSAVYSDIEGYASTASCKAAVLSYLSGWTERLHSGGYLSGFYSSASSGIKDAASEYGNSAYTRVDHIFYAWWNGAADTDTGSYVPSTYWAGHQRIHQYAGNVTESYGGYSINIDRDYLDVGTGTPPAPTCTGTNLDFTAYPTVRSGSTGDQVKAAQCLLKAAGYDPGAPDGTFGAATTTATQNFQSGTGLTADGVIGSKTWTALLSRGTTPTVQSGSTGEAVTRLQRALTAALGRTVTVDGAFGPGTDQAVRDYQSSRALTVDGIVGSGTWGALQSGR